jgi:hypothetical protein
MCDFEFNSRWSCQNWNNSVEWCLRDLGGSRASGETTERRWREARWIHFSDFRCENWYLKSSSFNYTRYL